MWRLLRFVGRSTRRMAVLLVGCGVVGAGAVMLVTPGPGLVVIVAGLAILATEFTWAEILLERARRQARKAKDAAVEKAGRRFRRRQVVEVRVTEIDLTVDVLDVRPEHGPPVPEVLRRSRYVQTYTVAELTESISAADAEAEARSACEAGQASPASDPSSPRS
jgi:uncharacterized protein (TIGR02611 family)